MGRPKALKQKDPLIKGLKIDANFENKKKTLSFSDEQEEFSFSLEEKSNLVQSAKQDGEEQEEEPEEVQASSLEILQLKKQLEETSTLKKSSTKLKRKKLQVIQQHDVLLDEAIFEKDESDHGSEEINLVSKPQTVISAPTKIENTHIRNFGSLEVRLREGDGENPAKKFKLSKEVEAFAKLRSSSIKRTKYGSFIAQRRAKPSQSFVVSSKA